MGRATRRHQRADGSGNSGAPGSSRPEPTRLRLTIGSGPSALPLIGAGTSDRAPGQAGKWSLRAGPTPTGMLGVGGSDRPKPQLVLTGWRGGLCCRRPGKRAFGANAAFWGGAALSCKFAVTTGVPVATLPCLQNSEKPVARSWDILVLSSRTCCSLPREGKDKQAIY